jgi:hypothetical protein
VDRAQLKQHVLAALARYWPASAELVGRLPIAEQPFPIINCSLALIEIPLPKWAATHGVGGILVVPREACTTPENPNWQTVDWWLAIFLLLECWHERAWEQEHGVIHSYSNRLKRWDHRIWERAWVNRIALFLRSWVTFSEGREDTEIFGPLPRAELHITHDVDAVSKTLSIRLKQGLFIGYNAIRLFLARSYSAAIKKTLQGIRFVFLRDEWWKLDAVQNLERSAGLRSQFNFYADLRPWSPSRWLFDPGYNIKSPKMRALLKDLEEGGWSIGLHQSFDAWNSVSLIRSQRECLESLITKQVNSCRQHWLRFGWATTWSSQSKAGLSQDTTLMFNDRPGFRAGAAVGWSPWDAGAGKSHALRALPTIFMDSHFFDYQQMNAEQRQAAFHYWLGEIAAVGGEAAVLWHPHSLSRDYGWGDDFRELINCIKEFTARSQR